MIIKGLFGFFPFRHECALFSAIVGKTHCSIQRLEEVFAFVGLKCHLDFKTLAVSLLFKIFEKVT